MACTTIIKRGFSSSMSLNNTIKHVTIIGGGLMGSGIAQVSAQTGFKTTVVEVTQDALNKSEANIKASIPRVAKKLFKDNATERDKYISDTLGRIEMTLKLEDSVKNTDLIIEAIIENIDKKHELFKTMDAAAPQHTIFASNTSSLSIADIASVTNRKDRFAGLHFFNPVPVMRLLEVIKIPETSDETYKTVMAWGKSIGKTTITCKDTPGFVVNKLLGCFQAEALKMAEQGIATVEDIDIGIKLGLGHPMGPFELTDYTGVDLTKFIRDAYHKRFPNDEQYRPSKLIDKLVSEGKFGRKTGEGFYKYNK